MKAEECRIGREKSLFTLCFIVSLVAWLVLVLTLVGLFYGLMIGFFLFVAHGLMIAYIKGNGIRLSQEQLPRVFQKVVDAAERLEMKTLPEVYVLQAGGMLNAFATKFIGRNFVVIYSDLLEACEEDGKEMDMIIGHELGHLALGHLKWLLFLSPTRIIPWLGTAYSRACEYSCDRCGYLVAGDLAAASRGLVILAAGGRYAAKVNLDAFVQQAQDTQGFWTSVFELNASHPFLPKRVAALINLENPGTVPVPGRNFFAYPLAPLFGFASPAGAAPLMAIAMIGILASIAIPQFQVFRNQAQAAEAEAKMDSSLEAVYDKASVFFASEGRWPCTIEEAGAEEVATLARNQGWDLEVDCEYGAIIYTKEGQKHYKVVYFETAEKNQGVLRD